MSCLCLLHIFTQTIVMEMIVWMILHTEGEASPQLSVWDANREMFYDLKHTHTHTRTAERVRCNGSMYAISVEQTPGSSSAFIALVFVSLRVGRNKRGGIKMQFKFWKTFQRNRSGKFKWSRLRKPSLLWNISSWLHSGGGPLIKWLQKRSNATRLCRQSRSDLKCFNDHKGRWVWNWKNAVWF